MKAMMLNGTGEPRAVLAWSDVPEPASPGEGQAIVRVTGRSIHPADTMAIRGLLPLQAFVQAFVQDGVPGIDGVGIVESMGPGIDPASGITTGARVILNPVRRSWSERIVAPAAAMTLVPDDMGDAVACQLATNGITALMLTRKAVLASWNSNETAPLVVTAASSGVARILIALAGLQDRKVIGLIRRDADAGALAYRFDNLQVIGTDRPDWQKTLLDLAGGSPEVALDLIGGEMMQSLLPLLAERGTLITYGSLDPRPASVSSGLVTGKELTIKGVSAASWGRTASAAQRNADYDVLFDLARQTPHLFADYREFPPH